jgi:hypothetical protein
VYSAIIEEWWRSKRQLGEHDENEMEDTSRSVTSELELSGLGLNVL